MILSDNEIQELQDCIDPFYFNRIQPASYDVALGNTFRYFKDNTPIDPRNPGNYTVATVRSEAVGYPLGPLKFVLAATVEWVSIPNDIACEVRGKSSLGRMGLSVHATAGWIDPGYEGKITLELFNCGPTTIMLKPGMLIAQLAFHELKSPAAKPYGHEDLKSKYQNSGGVSEAKGIGV